MLSSSPIGGTAINSVNRVRVNATGEQGRSSKVQLCWTELTRRNQTRQNLWSRCPGTHCFPRAENNTKTCNSSIWSITQPKQWQGETTLTNSDILHNFDLQCLERLCKSLDSRRPWPRWSSLRSNWTWQSCKVCWQKLASGRKPGRMEHETSSQTCPIASCCCSSCPVSTVNLTIIQASEKCLARHWHYWKWHWDPPVSVA